MRIGFEVRFGQQLTLTRRSCDRRFEPETLRVRHGRDVTPAMIWLPPETPVPEVGKQRECSKHGSRKINTKAELYPGSVAAIRAR